MIPASFEYHRPQDMAGVLAVLEEHGDDARVMAGGHSLIPMMKLRMADVPHLIDLQDVGELSGIEVSTDSIRIGALVTQADIIDHVKGRALGKRRRICDEDTHLRRAGFTVTLRSPSRFTIAEPRSYLSGYF